MEYSSEPFQAIHIHSTKSEETSIWIFIHLFFESATILIFSGIFLHRLYRIPKFKIKWIRVPTTEFSRKKQRTRRNKPNQLKPVGGKERSFPKATPKIDPLSTGIFQRIGYDKYSTQY